MTVADANFNVSIDIKHEVFGVADINFCQPMILQYIGTLDDLGELERLFRRLVLDGNTDVQAGSR